MAVVLRLMAPSQAGPFAPNAMDETLSSSRANWHRSKVWSRSEPSSSLSGSPKRPEASCILVLSSRRGVGARELDLDDTSGCTAELPLRTEHTSRESVDLSEPDLSLVSVPSARSVDISVTSFDDFLEAFLDDCRELCLEACWEPSSLPSPKLRSARAMRCCLRTNCPARLSFHFCSLACMRVLIVRFTSG
mmetsp:Transcript_13359/g.22847  ORF Transcript_13359/g.22847 Transcript_13359/m.22847 type:complete len:191 (-) Transcript_13359:2114-2686(-)